MKTLDEVALEIGRAVNLPAGTNVTVDKEAKVILVANDDLGFCITQTSIDNDLYLSIMRETLPRFIEETAKMRQDDAGMLSCIASQFRERSSI